MKKILFGFVTFLLLLSFVFLNLGKWIDVTDKPVKADIIVCLGGGDHHRFEKSIELYGRGYAKKNMLLLTGSDVTAQMRRKGIKDGRITYLKKHYSQTGYLYAPKLASTRDEVKYIKMYMKTHACQSALIVTDPPHSRRFSVLSTLIAVEGDENMTFHMVASGVKWWDRDHYYKNRVAREYVMWEIIKIPYNIIMYLMEEDRRSLEKEYKGSHTDA